MKLLAAFQHRHTMLRLVEGDFMEAERRSYDFL